MNPISVKRQEPPVSPSAPVIAPGAPAAPRLSWRDLSRQGGLFGALILLSLVFTAFYPGFVAPGNIVNILLGASIIAIVSIGQMLVIVTGGIDLSIGSILAVGGVVGAKLMVAGVPTPVAIGAGLAAGAACGAVNALIIVTTRVTPFIVTLGTSQAFTGIALLITDGRPVYGLPENFTAPATSVIGGLPVPVWLMILTVIVFTIVLHRTLLGEYAIAVGGNEEAARLSGLRVGAIKVAIYATAGGLGALGGLLTAARLGSADPSSGSDLLLISVAAAVMGGASLMGGEGSVIGSAIGAVVVVALQTGLTLLGIATYYQIIAIGLVIIAAVTIDQFARRQSGKPMLLRLRAAKAAGRDAR